MRSGGSSFTLKLDLITLVAKRGGSPGGTESAGILGVGGVIEKWAWSFVDDEGIAAVKVGGVEKSGDAHEAIGASRVGNVSGVATRLESGSRPNADDTGRVISSIVD